MLEWFINLSQLPIDVYDVEEWSVYFPYSVLESFWVEGEDGL